MYTFLLTYNASYPEWNIISIFHIFVLKSETTDF